MLTRNHSSLFITIRFPVSSYAQPLQLYTILSFPVLTTLLGITLNSWIYQTTSIIIISPCQLKTRKTVHDSTVYCNFNMALISTTVAQCSLALFQNKAKRASSIYNVRFIENHISHDIIELTPTSVMVYQNEELLSNCPQSDTWVYILCLCLWTFHVNVLCQPDNFIFYQVLCIAITWVFFVCVLLLVHFALVQKFFDEQTLSEILGKLKIEWVSDCQTQQLFSHIMSRTS